MSKIVKKSQLNYFAQQFYNKVKTYANGLNDVLNAKVEANTDAIEKLQEGLGVIEDIHLDATADNKYNGETGNVELYLNDGTEMIYKVIAIDKDSENTTFYDTKSDEVILNVVTSTITSSQQLSNMLQQAYFPQNTTFRLFNKTTFKYEELDDSNYSYIMNADSNYSFFAYIGNPKTKVEVDMSELTDDIETNANNITSLTDRVKAVESVITNESIDAIINGLQ